MEIADATGRQVTLSMKLLQVIGDQLARRERYRNTKGIDAVILYLAMTYKWTPSQVKAMSWDDMAFMMSEEELDDLAK